MYLSESDKFIFVKSCDIFKLLKFEKSIKDYLDKLVTEYKEKKEQYLLYKAQKDFE